MVNALLGPAWEESVTDKPSRKWYRFLLDFGALGALVCRIVENPKREADEKAPSHLIFHSPLAGGEDVRFGALWPHTNEETGASYLIGSVDLAALGAVELRGGGKIDLRLLDGKVNVRLSALKQRRNDRTPTHQLWRTKERTTKAEAGPTAPMAATDLPPDADEDGESAAA